MRERRCAGCEARQSEIEFLRRQIVEASERLAALLGLSASVGQQRRDPVVKDGVEYVWVGEGYVPASDYSKLANQAVVFVNDKAVNASEYRATIERLDSMMSGD